MTYIMLSKNVRVFKQYFKQFFTTSLTFLLLALGACSTNPATGKKSFTAFMSIEKEKEVGAREHPRIVERFGGIYRDDKLNLYVSRIGSKLVKFSELPDLKYTFTILNDEKVNAFALPGGYIYVTRGLLAIVGNEAEMAGVLAHEIAHITARHSSQRYSVTKAKNIGLRVLGVVGSIAGAPTGASQLATLGGEVALKSYSREQELEADMLALRYLSRAGYDPSALTSFFYQLKAHKELLASMKGQKSQFKYFDFLSTHPLTTQRIAKARRIVSQTVFTEKEKGKDAYARAINGLIFGDDPNQGIRRGRIFEHPAIGIRFKVPPGFTMFNTPERLTAKSNDGSIIFFDVGPKNKIYKLGSIANYVRAIRFKGYKFQNLKNVEINGMNGVTAIARVIRNGKQRNVHLLVIKKSKNQIFRLLFETSGRNTNLATQNFMRTMRSFRRLSQKEIFDIKPLRIRFKAVSIGDSVETLAQDMPVEGFGLEWFELLNKTKRGTPLETGQHVRIITK